MKSKHCNWCDNSFETTINYQIYCSAECREAATREKITERYNQKKKTNKKYQNRKCKSCGTTLSVYNDQQICNSCLINPSEVSKILKEIKGLGNGKNSSKN